MKIKLSFDHEVDPQMIDDLLVTAFEGGINYWCNKAEVQDGDYKGGTYASDVVSRGGTVLLHDAVGAESGDDTVHAINLDKMLSGISVFCNKRKITPEILWETHDAGDADLVVQYAIFGEQIYA